MKKSNGYTKGLPKKTDKPAPKKGGVKIRTKGC